MEEIENINTKESFDDVLNKITTEVDELYSNLDNLSSNDIKQKLAEFLDKLKQADLPNFTDETFKPQLGHILDGMCEKYNKGDDAVAKMQFSQIVEKALDLN
jgi:hypothetical protein